MYSKHYYIIYENECFILIVWLVFTIFGQFMLNLGKGWSWLNLGAGGNYINLKRFPAGTIHLWNRYFRVIFIYFLSPLKRRHHCLFFVCCQHSEAWKCCYYYYIVEFECVFFFYLQNVMLCTKHIIVFSLMNSFPIVLSGEA